MKQEKLLDEKGAARFLGLSVYTLRNWRHQLRPPNYVKLGGRAVRYRLDDLEEFIEKSWVRRS